jgi:alcohol dehydrogenase (NADP+)
MPHTNPGTNQSQWYDKYKVDCSAQGAPNLMFLDFSGVKEISAEDWAAAQEIERRELAARPAALLKAQKALYRRVENMPMITLRDGTTMPAVGLGTWKAEKGQVRAAVHIALQAGYRHIDCASVYQNEDEVGDALDYALSRKLIDRSELYICSKVWNNDHAPDRVRAACLRSIKALKLDYLDLYLIHWPVTGNVGNTVTPSIKDTWRALESLVKDGYVRSIGTSNFSAKKLAEIMEYAEVLPSVCQVEIHPYHRNDALINWCKENKIHVTAFSPLGSPDSESIFPRKVPAVLLKDPIVNEISQKMGKNVGQILVRWAIQHGTSVIPKSTNPDRLRGNLDVLDWELSKNDYAKLSSFKFQQRMVNGAMWLNPRGPYRTMEDLWDEAELEDFEASDVGICLCEEVVEEVIDKKEGVVEVEEKKKVEREEGGSQSGGSSPRKEVGGKSLGGRLANWLGKKK